LIQLWGGECVSFCHLPPVLGWVALLFDPTEQMDNYTLVQLIQLFKKE